MTGAGESSNQIRCLSTDRTRGNRAKSQLATLNGAATPQTPCTASRIRASRWLAGRLTDLCGAMSALAPISSAHRVAGGSHPPPAPTERSVRISRTTPITKFFASASSRTGAGIAPIGTPRTAGAARAKRR